MDVFQLRDQVIGDYAAYVRSFLRIADPGIKGYVEEKLAEERLWPDPLVQLNPSFEPGATVDELVDRAVLHPECRGIFRRGKDKTPPEDAPLRLHRHQQEAMEVARTGASYVLTTGTGSGKSLAYFVPIVDHGRGGGPGGCSLGSRRPARGRRGPRRLLQAVRHARHGAVGHGAPGLGRPPRARPAAHRRGDRHRRARVEGGQARLRRALRFPGRRGPHQVTHDRARRVRGSGGVDRPRRSAHWLCPEGSERGMECKCGATVPRRSGIAHSAAGSSTALRRRIEPFTPRPRFGPRRNPKK